MALHAKVGILLGLVAVCLSSPQYGSQGGSKGGGSVTCDSGYDCVPWQTCINGYISADGGSGIDQRTRPANYDSLQCGASGNMCCAIEKPIEEIIGDSQCGHSSYACVPYFQCVEGEINTDGTGLIDIRIRPTGTCINPEYPDVPAVCCLIPGSHPTPPPVESCPQYTECVEYNLCSGDGKIVTDGTGVIDIRTGYTSCYLPTGIGGRCCTPPSPFIDACPGDSVCVIGTDCVGQALDASNNFIDYVTTGLWSECSYGAGNGICCINPPPFVDVCPGDSVCVVGLNCLGTALDASNNFIDYVSTGRWSVCSYGIGDGICCVNPPPYVDACPGKSVCTYGSECLGQALDGSSNFIDYISVGVWTTCSIGGAIDGICCIPPRPKKLDRCPGESICLPSNECKGQALNDLEAFVDYSSQGSWSYCSEYEEGVCCINPFVKPDLVPAGKCGIRNYDLDSRILSKKDASFGEFPWQSIIFYQNYTFNCGASLLSNKHVITAAHCVHGLLASDLRIRFGEWKVNGFDEALPYYDRNVYALYVHPKFNPRNVHNDVAILELENPIDFFYHINAICLPQKGQIIDAYTRCFASGWGKDSFGGSFQHILKKIDLPYVDHDKCQNLLRKTRLGRYFRLHSSFVCAGGEENKDACYGDGGGPLVCKPPNSDSYVLTGITAWGIGCGTANVPGVYVDVQEFVPWIENIIAGHGGSQQQQQQQSSAPGYGK